MSVAFNPSFKANIASLEKTLNAKQLGGKVLVKIQSKTPGAYAADCFSSDAKGRILGAYSERISPEAGKKQYMEQVDLFVNKLKTACEDTPAIKEIKDFLTKNAMK